MFKKNTKKISKNLIFLGFFVVFILINGTLIVSLRKEE